MYRSMGFVLSRHKFWCQVIGALAAVNPQAGCVAPENLGTNIFRSLSRRTQC